MELMMPEKQHAHALLDRVSADQMTAAVRFLEFLLLSPVDRNLPTAPEEDEEITDDEAAAVARSKKWFRDNEGTGMEQLASELGLTMEQIQRPSKDPGA